jgi:hypothetical protein
MYSEQDLTLACWVYRSDPFFRQFSVADIALIIRRARMIENGQEMSDGQLI